MTHPFCRLKKSAWYGVNSGGGSSIPLKSRTTCPVLCSKVGGGGTLDGPGCWDAEAAGFELSIVTIIDGQTRVARGCARFATAGFVGLGCRRWLSIADELVRSFGRHSLFA
jgi:hypothetical protein